MFFAPVSRKLDSGYDIERACVSTDALSAKAWNCACLGLTGSGQRGHTDFADLRMLRKPVFISQPVSGRDETVCENT